MMCLMHHALRKTVSGMMLAAILLVPGTALAQDEASDRPDARVEGFATGGADGQNQQVGPLLIKDGGGNAGTWFILVGLGLLGLGVMFKPGKRTHLD
jgi:hypothetical protein